MTMRQKLATYSTKYDTHDQSNCRNDFHVLYEVCSDLRHKSLNVITTTNIHYHEFCRECCTKKHKILDLFVVVFFFRRKFSNKSRINFRVDPFSISWIAVWMLLRCCERNPKEEMDDLKTKIHTSIQKFRAISKMIWRYIWYAKRKWKVYRMWVRFISLAVHSRGVFCFVRNLNDKSFVSLRLSVYGLL